MSTGMTHEDPDDGIAQICNIVAILCCHVVGHAAFSTFLPDSSSNVSSSSLLTHYPVALACFS